MLILVLRKVIVCVCEPAVGLPPPNAVGLLTVKEAMLHILYMLKCIG
jgi:hypothetical protein